MLYLWLTTQPYVMNGSKLFNKPNLWLDYPHLCVLRCEHIRTILYLVMPFRITSALSSLKYLMDDVFNPPLKTCFEQFLIISQLTVENLLLSEAFQSVLRNLLSD